MRRGKVSLHVLILLALVLGATGGLLAQKQLPADHPGLTNFLNYVAKPAGTLFMNMIFMVVVPLLFSALVLGVAEIGDARRVGRIGLRALGFTVLFSGIAVALGLTLVNVFKPGNLNMPEEKKRAMIDRFVPPDKNPMYKNLAPEVVIKEGTPEKKDTLKEDVDKKVAQASEAKNTSETIVDMVPKNPLASAVSALEGGLLPFMFFTLIFGIALTSIEAEKALPIKQFLEGLFAISIKIVGWAMFLAPLGVFGFAFNAGATLGVDAFMALLKYAGLVLFGLAFHLFVVYSIALKVFAKRSPLEFFRQMKGVMMTAFATSSSNATLPYALKAAEEEVGLPRDTSSFVLTVGATANQNGTALFEGITLIFLAQFFGVDLSFGDQIIVMLMAILAGVGTAGVPGGAWPMIAIILLRIGVPAEAIGICLGIDRILDMSRTVLNVTGDMTIACCVDAGEQNALAREAARA